MTDKLKQFRVPLRITGTAFVMATSARKAHAKAREVLGGKVIRLVENWRLPDASVQVGAALVIYGPEGVNEITTIGEQRRPGANARTEQR